MCSFQIVKDWHLSMIVVAMCLVVVIIGVVVAIVADYKAVQVPDLERPITRNVRFSASVIANYNTLVSDSQVEINFDMLLPS